MFHLIGRDRSAYRLCALMAIVCFGLIWVLYQQLQSLPHSQLYQDDQIVDEVRAPLVPALPAAPEFTMAPASRFDEILRRPIFSSTRRPPPEQKAVAEPPIVDPDLVLTGIIISAPEPPIAIAFEKTSLEAIRLTEGTVYFGWTLTRILPDRVILQRQGIQKEFELAYEQASGDSARLIETVVRDPDPNARRQATQRLAQLSVEGMRRAVMAAASDPDPGVRQVAEAFLAEWGCPDQSSPICPP